MTKETLKAMRATLNSIEVRGRENLDGLLGCILALDSEIRDMEAAEKAAKDPKKEDGENG